MSVSRAACFVSFVLWAAPALAEQACEGGFGCPRPELEHLVSTCLAEAQTPSARADCPQKVLALCFELTGDGQTTVGIAECQMSAARAWQGALTQASAKLGKAFAARAPDGAELAARFEDMQATWRAQRAAACAFEYTLHGPGSARIVAGAICEQEMTVARTLELWALKDVWAPDAWP
ncbi:MAG: lysozyme inhibitor LprI family protein [Pseudomonadota bacterium]